MLLLLIASSGSKILLYSVAVLTWFIYPGRYKQISLHSYF